MTQKSNLIKQKKILYLINKYKKKREFIFFQIYSSNNAKSLNDKIYWVFKFQTIPRNSSLTRLRNYCSITGRSRGYYRFFGISRNMLRFFAQKNILPGVQKSSW